MEQKPLYAVLAALIGLAAGRRSAVRYTLTAYYSKPDVAGNCYWAFHYCDSAGRIVEGLVTGGESNINGIRYELNGGVWPAPDVCTWQCIGLPIRQFNRMTKTWKHAGCLPAELAAYIRAQLGSE